MKRGFLTWLFRLSLAAAITGLFAPPEAAGVITPINSQALVCASGDISARAVEPVAATPQTAAASILSYEALDVCGNDPVNNCDPVGLDAFTGQPNVEENDPAGLLAILFPNEYNKALKLEQLVHEGTVHAFADPIIAQLPNAARAKYGPSVLLSVEIGLSVAEGYMAARFSGAGSRNPNGKPLSSKGSSPTTGSPPEVSVPKTATIVPGAKSAGQLGREGEALASQITGAAKNGESWVVNGRTRIPDQVLAQDIGTRAPTIITEVKNVQYQSLTRQLRDYADLAGPGGRVDVALPPGARVSGPLQRAFADLDNPLNRMNLVPSR